MWVPIIKRARKNTGFCPEVIWRAVKWARVERVGERWWCWCCWYTTGWPLLRMKVPMNGLLFYEAQVASVFIRTLPEKGALVLYLTKLPKKKRSKLPDKKVEDQVARKKKKSKLPEKRRRAGLQTAQRSPAPGWQTLTAASNNQTTPHTNLHFSFFHNIVNALFPFIQWRWLKYRNWRHQPPEF